jgi:biopolymer transport protein ExbB/TolQ
MFTRIAPVLIFSAVALLSLSAQAETYKQERAAHPRIARAIHELREVVKYLEAAPHDFGGAKAAAIASSNQAIKDLQAALKYREAKDTMKGK